MFGAIGFVLGHLFGSFLNVCISRLPQRESVVHPSSRCPQCGAAIRWFDNVPLLSWILLRGRCRDCKQSIPWRYPLVELATGLWLLYAATLSESSHLDLPITVASAPFPTHSQIAIYLISVLGIAILGFLLIGLMVMDWQTHLLPNAFTLWGIFIGFLLVCVQAAFLPPDADQVVLSNNHIQLTSPGSVVDTGNVFLTGPEHLVLGRIAAICGAALVLLIVRWLYKALRHREGMGLGDVKLIAMIAAFLGFWPLPLAFFRCPAGERLRCRSAPARQGQRDYQTGLWQLPRCRRAGCGAVRQQAHRHVRRAAPIGPYYPLIT